MSDEKEGLDIEAGSAQIAGSLFGTEPEAPAPEEAGTTAEPPVSDAPVEGQPAPVEVKPAPKSWGKETHDLWAKLPPEAQAQIEKREFEALNGINQYREHSELGKAMKDVVTPYLADIQAQGIDPPKAFASLLNAHYRLTRGSPESRAAAYRDLGVNLGLVQAQAQQHVDPALAEQNERLARLEGALTQRQQEALQQHRAKVESEVATFADAVDEKGNKTRPYFDEVADEVVTFINAGASLQDAYDKAVYANPVTRAKELARLKSQADAELRAKGKVEAESARKASSTNVRSRDTSKSPTGPLGKMDDTMRETLAAIKGRAH